MVKLCECGCGKEVRFEVHRFIKGHQCIGKKLSIEHRQKISQGNVGRVHSEETKQKIKQSNLQTWSKQEILDKVSGGNNQFFGKTHTDEVKKRLSDCYKGKTYEQIMGKEKSDLRKQKFKEANVNKDKIGKSYEEIYGEEKAKEIKRKLKDSHTGYIMPREQVEKIRKANIGKKHTEEMKKKMREMRIGNKNPMFGKSDIAKKTWENPIIKENRIRQLHNFPNKKESYLMILLNELFPNEYRYSGDGSFIIGFKKPDFVNVNGKKKCIEFYGDYFHKHEKTNNGINRINHFKSYGWDCLIVWESELKNIENVKNKLIVFHNEVLK